MVDAERNLKRCRRKMKIIQLSILDIDNYIQIFNPKTGTPSELLVRKASLTELRRQFHDLFDEYIELLDQDDLSADTTNIIKEFEDSYHRTLSIIEGFLEHFNTKIMAITHPSSERQSMVKLPEMKIQPFNGNYETWMSFKETFKSVIIDRTDISPVIKIEYLKNTVTSELRGMVDGVEPNEAVFSSAWSQLCERYDNKRIIIESHVKAILNAKSLVRESATDIRQLLDSTVIHLRALNVLNQPIDKWDILLVYIITSKLDSETIKEWHKGLEYNEIPTWKKLSDFLQCRARTLESIENSKAINVSSISKQNTSSKPTFNSFKKDTKGYNSSRSFVVGFRACQLCSSTMHKLSDCNQFEALSPKEKFEKINELHLCRNCFGTHMKRNCESKNVCRKCRGYHHTSLHDYFSQLKLNNIQKKPNEQGGFTAESNHTNASTSKFINTNSTNSNIIDTTSTITAHCNTKTFSLLTTALVYAFDIYGHPQLARVLLDSASQSNFITESFREVLGIKKQHTNHIVCGVNQLSTEINGKIYATIQSRVSEYSEELEFLCLKKITGNLPSESINIQSWNLPENIQLADPSFHKSGKIDMLCGSNIFWKVLGNNQINLGNNLPIFRETAFGYIIGGRIDTSSKSDSFASFCFVVTNEELNRQVKLFWEIENCITKPQISNEQKECENHFIKNHTRHVSGRYTVSLPFKKSSIEKLGHSKSIAMKRFLSLERKLTHNEKLKNDYIQFMNEYITLGHMKKIQFINLEKPHYFIPHHAVVKPDSSTTKLRVVFDASCPTSTGFSLNDCLMIGPTVQQELFDIILRFRSHFYVFTADIEKMYRQVQVHSNDQPFQLILWRESADQTISTFALQTVTYGTASAPYLATRVLQQLSFDEMENFPKAVPLMRDFYVDDILTGSNNIHNLQEAKFQLINMLKGSGMKLRKFSSNQSSLLCDIPTEDLEKAISFKDSSCNEIIKTLGLIWDPINDNLHFNSKLIEINQNEITKRVVLSIISSIFDPLGLISPFIIISKIFMQKLWLLKLEWDERLSDNELNEFNKFISGFKDISKFNIKRCVIPKEYHHIELHGFSDSSILAYGAAIYIRTVSTSNYVDCNLLCSKSRVCPLKKFTLAKMELCAAVLLSELIHRIIQALDIKFDQVVLWTDSTITLSWIKSQPNTLKTFESHRVATIQQLTSDFNWYHVRSKLNPADIITRGQNMADLMDNYQWWHGPDYLLQNNEVIETLMQVNVFVTQTEDDLMWIFLKCSHFIKLVTSVGYWLRAVDNIKKSKLDRIYGSITINEFIRAKYCVIYLAQSQVFPTELRLLKKGKEIPNSSQLKSLAPILDENQILRVGGRLRHAQLSENSKHPVILPKNHHLSSLLVRYFHEKTHHAGAQLLLYTVRQEYWPINGKQLTKHIIKKCICCFRNNPRNDHQSMGDLPKPRVTPSSPFTFTGLDYCGPFMLKNKHQRKGPIFKAYIAVFVCFSTKAIHLDVVSDLTSECCLQAISRFVAHHGKPAEIHCDNSKTFIGVNNDLKTFQQFLIKHSDQIISHLIRDEIKFMFIPPYSPTFGGLWESSVKSVKHHLKRISNDQKFTFEELITICSDIEACLNSRPLTLLSNDPDDPLPLTSGHFLIGRPLVAINRPSYVDVKSNLLTRWQFIQQLVQSFWRRWSREYLNTLQQRNKWSSSKLDIKINDVVLIHSDNLPPTQWLLGIVVEVHPGQDNKIRVVSVKTKNDFITRRSINKIFKLPL